MAKKLPKAHPFKADLTMVLTKKFGLLVDSGKTIKLYAPTNLNGLKLCSQGPRYTCPSERATGGFRCPFRWKKITWTLGTTLERTRVDFKGPLCFCVEEGNEGILRTREIALN